MSDRYFLDTNIFIYTFDVRYPEKQEIAKQLISEGLERNHTSVSWQVIQEFINASTRKFAEPITLTDCKLYVDTTLAPMWDIYPTRDLIHSALDLSERWQYSFYDSLIIASALQASCTILYSEDLQHEQTIKSLQIIDPFQ